MLKIRYFPSFLLFQKQGSLRLVPLPDSSQAWEQIGDPPSISGLDQMRLGWGVHLVDWPRHWWC